MSLWDDLGTFFGNDGSSATPWWSGLGQPLATAGANAISANNTVAANNTAAQIAQQGQQQRAAMIEGANAQNQTMLGTQIAQDQPGTSYLRTVVGSNPGQLTPAQESGLEQAQQIGKTQLATSGMRGSGQAELDVLRGIGNSYVGNAIATNTGRADSAAGQLNNGANAATGEAVNSNLNAATGAGNAVATGAMYPAAATTSNAAVTGSAMGDISSLIASNNKSRLSRYPGNPTANDSEAGQADRTADSSNAFAGGGP